MIAYKLVKVLGDKLVSLRCSLSMLRRPYNGSYVTYAKGEVTRRAVNCGPLVAFKSEEVAKAYIESKGSTITALAGIELWEVDAVKSIYIRAFCKCNYGKCRHWDDETFTCKSDLSLLLNGRCISVEVSTDFVYCDTVILKRRIDYK